MFFLMECRRHEARDADRDRRRPAHRDWVRSGDGGTASVLIGSALWDAGGVGIGHWGVLEADTEADAHDFAEGFRHRRHRRRDAAHPARRHLRGPAHR